MGLDVYAIWKSYEQVDALKGVDLNVKAGEFFTLLGPSGCGKTTLLRIIAGLEMPDRGIVMLGDQSVTWLSARERPVNTVFQSYALFPHLTVLENICFGLISRRVAKGEAIDRARRILDLVQLNGCEGRFPKQMSGGQQQRVALARALVNEPEVLLLDEPMSALDAKLRTQVQVELHQLQRRLGRTFVMVTHDQSEALTVSDRMAVMNVGEVAQVGDVREVYDTPHSRFVADFLGMENFIDAKPAGEYEAETVYGRMRVQQKLPMVPCVLGIRPENIRLVDLQAPGAVRARVSAAIYRGTEQLLLLEGGLKVKTGVARSVKAGDEIALTFPEEDVVVLYE